MSSVFGSHQSGTTQTVQTNDPWSGVQPYLTNLFSRGNSVLQSQPQVDPLITQAVNSQAAAAQDPNGLVSQAQGVASDTLGGKYLSPTSNPYLSGAVQQALDQVKQNVNSQFRGDNYGSSANQEFLAKTLANTALPIYAQNYGGERANQLAALQAAPGLQSANAQQLASAGQLRTDAPYASLRNFQGLLSSGQGYGTGTSTQPYFTNPIGNAAGGALAGYALGGPVGSIIGGGIGLLGGR